MTKKFPAIRALPRRNAAWILSVFLGLPMLVLAEASTREAAERKARRLAACFCLEVANVPEKTEYLKPGEGGY